MINVDILEDGHIIACNNTIADSVLFEKIRFIFPNTWNGYTKTDVFRNGETTVSVVLNGDSGLCTGDAPSEPTPTEYEQLVSIANDTKQIAASVRTDADSRAFKGDKCEKGEPGNIENIDQVYSPTSENAQIGKAIETVIDNCARAIISSVNLKSKQINLNDTSNKRLVGISIYGNSNQDTEPFPDNPVLHFISAIKFPS